MRKIDCVYQDPLDVIWTEAARSIGMTVERDATVFASWDGIDTLRIGTQETLDPDDSLAQMILHEICHALIEGPQCLTLPDWGLENSPTHLVHEHACLRLQAALTTPFGLRELLASTTIFRSYYDQLPENPLEPNSNDPAVQLASDAWSEASNQPWISAINHALQLTAEISNAMKKIAPPDSIWSRSTSP